MKKPCDDCKEPYVKNMGEFRENLCPFTSECKPLYIWTSVQTLLEDIEDKIQDALEGVEDCACEDDHSGVNYYRIVANTYKTAKALIEGWANNL